jgi:hypothetical protein
MGDCRVPHFSCSLREVGLLPTPSPAKSKRVLSPEDLFASFSYQAGEIVLYVVDEVICKNVESTLSISYLVVEE